MILNPMILDLQDAWRNLFRRPSRSLLSGLGIGIGVAALIAMISITEGAKRAAFQKFSSLGLLTLRIEAATAKPIGQESTANLSPGLISNDVIQLEQWLGERGTVGLFLKRDNIPITVGNRTILATVLGVNAAWFTAEGVQVTHGRILEGMDIASRENVCIIGASVAALLQSEVLSTIQLDHHVSTIVGITAKKGRLLTEGTGLSSIDFDNAIIVPYSAMPFSQVIAGRLLLHGLVIAFNKVSEKSVLFLAEQISQILMASHRQVNDFQIVVPLTLLREAEDSQKLFSLIVGAIAALSLLVGGIGVMNIMLANIAEQTREIALRIAVGAPPARILNIYLCQSILLSVTGAAWGVAVGMLVSLLIENLANLPVVFSPLSILVAPFFAILTGVVFGLHPACRAASMEPALALRDA